MAAKKSNESSKNAASTRAASTRPATGAQSARGGGGAAEKNAGSKAAAGSKGGKTKAAGAAEAVPKATKAPATATSAAAAAKRKKSGGAAQSSSVGKSTAKKATSKTTKAASQPPAAKRAVRTSERKPVKTTVLTVGDAVPEFEALDQDGELVQSGMLSGAPYVIYFYPKDDTPGCTTEACGFRDELAAFAGKGVKVIGVSPDSPAAHARFRQKYGLEFTLLADTEKKLVSLFGVWKLKQNYGREYWGVERSTFLVDASGKIANEWRGVKVAGHVPAVLDAAKRL